MQCLMSVPCSRLYDSSEEHFPLNTESILNVLLKFLINNGTEHTVLALTAEWT